MTADDAIGEALHRYLTTPVVVHRSFGKIPRLFRDSVITEKLDGTQAAVGIMKVTDGMRGHPDLDAPCVKHGRYSDGTEYIIYAQSRNRLISPWDDNYGFAQWVHDRSQTLAEDLGPGLHFGEFWGQGIQRGYGQRLKFFSLFNVSKWENQAFQTPDLRVVPVLKRWTFDTNVIRDTLRDLQENGSYAAPGFMDPEGIVVFHAPSQALFKVTLVSDLPKSVAASGAVIELAAA